MIGGSNEKEKSKGQSGVVAGQIPLRVAQLSVTEVRGGRMISQVGLTRSPLYRNCSRGHAGRTGRPACCGFCHHRISKHVVVPYSRVVRLRSRLESADTLVVESAIPLLTPPVKTENSLGRGRGEAQQQKKTFLMICLEHN